MTETEDRAATAGCPADQATPIHDRAFADDPDGVCARLREQGPLATVELAPGVPATLVLDHETALSVLRDPETFPKDSRAWQQHVPEDSPVLPMMMYRDNVLFQDGPEHRRLRGAITDSLERVDSFTLRRYVTESAEELIRGFAPSGRADLLNDYARTLPLLVLTRLFRKSSRDHHADGRGHHGAVGRRRRRAGQRGPGQLHLRGHRSAA